MISDEFFMQRALELARLGIGQVSPNPRVGCVVVHDGKIVGEGWHQKYGEAHAEVNAIHSVKDSSLLKDCTVYVNLEPCAHTGKTPPCADLLIRHHVKRVVISNKDPNPLVSGQGIQKLKEAGIQVDLGLKESAGEEVNKRFFTFLRKNRPYIILKWAETMDGFLARKNFDSKWISNEYARQLVHKWRSVEDGVLVGSQTARYDNPQLTVRDWTGRNPVRIVLDRFLKLDKALHLFDGSVPTLCYTTLSVPERSTLTFIQLEETDFLSQCLTDLVKRNIQSILVEGGAQTLEAFIKAGLWDEARIFSSPTSFGEGIEAPRISGELDTEECIFTDSLRVIKNPKA